MRKSSAHRSFTFSAISYANLMATFSYFLLFK